MNWELAERTQTNKKTGAQRALIGGEWVPISKSQTNKKTGAKRVIHALEDSTFINVHPNPLELRNIEELEDMLTCPSYNDFDKYKQLKQ